MAPSNRLFSLDEGVQELALLKDAGGGLVLACSTAGEGRDPSGLAEISRRTGLGVVMAASWNEVQYSTSVTTPWHTIRAACFCFCSFGVVGSLCMGFVPPSGISACVLCLVDENTQHRPLCGQHSNIILLDSTERTAQTQPRTPRKVKVCRNCLQYTIRINENFAAAQPRHNVLLVVGTVFPFGRVQPLCYLTSRLCDVCYVSRRNPCCPPAVFVLLVTR